MQVATAVRRFLLQDEPRPRHGAIVVAFSGGPDSTALLHALRHSEERRLVLVAAHLDHGIDNESADRSRQAELIARVLGVTFETARHSVPDHRESGESLESAARRIRYDYLGNVAERHDASTVVTAHHADDQKETVLLRLLFGSGFPGLAGIPAARGKIHRPFLDVERQEIIRYLERHRLTPVDDATNEYLTTPRNAVRHLLLPSLRRSDETIDERLLALAGTARSAVERIDQRLIRELRPTITGDTIDCSRSLFDALPPLLQAFAIGTLCRMVDTRSPSRRALDDLRRQLDSGDAVGTDLGAGRRIELAGNRLTLLQTHRQHAARPAPFAYTLTVPGEILIEEISTVFRIRRCRVEAWMRRGSRWRAGMLLDLSDGDQVTIRNRRPGDRMRPFGCDYSRRLKDVLIDRKMPREDRDQLPLLTVNGRIVWVPGVTIDHEARLTSTDEVWVAEIERAQGSLQ